MKAKLAEYAASGTRPALTMAGSRGSPQEGLARIRVSWMRPNRLKWQKNSKSAEKLRERLR